MNSIFKVLGPVMIGPSSSHTAGAGNIGRVAYMLTEGRVKSVKFILHGSFAETGKGHGTDKALIAGVLGFYPYDDRIKNAYEIAKEKGIIVSFEEDMFEDVHPNTVKISIITMENKEFEMMASSIGGGNISIISINGVRMEFSGEYPTLIIEHNDKVGMISKITTELAFQNINIVSLKLSREGRGDKATSIVETDSEINKLIVKQIENIEDVINVVYINRIN